MFELNVFVSYISPRIAARDVNGMTALHLAAYSDNDEALKVFCFLNFKIFSFLFNNLFCI